MMEQAVHGDIFDGVGFCGEKRMILLSSAWGTQGAALRYLISIASLMYAAVH